MRRLVQFCTCLLLFHHVRADLYLHMPRGSNNRLNEATATRANANRVFDSQNNNRGGYNVGDVDDDKSGNNEGKQYRMQYFQSASATPNVKDKTYLTVEWTNQHGCGGSENTNPQKQNCHMVLQYMCQDDVSSPVGTADTLRNGVTTQTPNHNRAGSLNENKNTAQNRKNNNINTERVLQESWDWYDKCYLRERNKGYHILTVYMIDWYAVSKAVRYFHFNVSGAPNYQLSIRDYLGQVPDDLLYNHGMNFATYDKPDYNDCAQKLRAGWWYNDCTYALPTGVYYPGGDYRPKAGFYDGMFWKDWRGYGHSLKVIYIYISTLM